MKPLHPASLILLAFSFLLAASTRGGLVLLVLCLVTGGLALVAARRHFVAILRRSRWLLVTMLLLFGWMTLGTPVPGLPGATREGLLLAAENMARLLIAIAVVALLLRRLEPPALVSGLHMLLAPLAPLGNFRDRLSVRLMLTLRVVDTMRSGANETASMATSLAFPMSTVGPADYLAIVSSVALLASAALT